MKAALSRLAVGLGAVVIAILAVPTAIGVGLICLVRAGVDRISE